MIGMNSFTKKTGLFVITAIFVALAVAPVCLAEPKINLQTLLSKRVPVLLEFGRGWCIPCKYMKPILDDTSKAFAGRAIVTTVDMDANKDLVRSFSVRMMPTQVFLLPDGKEFFRNEGTLERDQIAHVFAKMGVPGATSGTGPGGIPPQAQAGRPFPASR